MASMQVKAMDSQQQSRDKEVTSLRQQLIDFQAQSDEKTVIGNRGSSQNKERIKMKFKRIFG